MDSTHVITSTSLPFDEEVQRELLSRLETLRRVSAENGRDPKFSSFVAEVEAAWNRLNQGNYGICEECHQTLGADRLLSEPLARICLSELTGKQREALEDDLQFAAQIQRGLLPDRGLVHGRWHVDYVYEPLGLVSGDYCDVIVEDGDLYFILGDVSGKGIAASLLMSNLHAIFHSLVPLKLGLPDLVARANRLLLRSSLANQFVTLVCGRATATGEVEVVNAGHLAPLLIKNGVKGELNSSGLPLGMFAEAEFTSSSIKVHAGDTLLLFTDGLTETVDEDDTEFGNERLYEIAGTAVFEHPRELIDHCLKQLADFRRSAERRDDLSALALSYT